MADIFNFFDVIFCINLDSRTDRWNQAQQEFHRMGIVDKVVRVSGVEHNNPATGCHLSHAQCFKYGMDWGVNNILILEDDVEFFPGAISNLTKSIEDLPEDFDMFYLGANLDRYIAHKVTDHLAKLTGAFSTHAYCITNSLFPLLYTINQDVLIPHNDVYYAENIHPMYNCYLALPLVAGQRESYSDVQRKVMSSNRIFQERLANVVASET